MCLALYVLPQRPEQGSHDCFPGSQERPGRFCFKDGSKFETHGTISVDMSKSFHPIPAHQAVAICTREQAEELVNYDHHVVRVNERNGVMLTGAWMPVQEHAGPFILTVVFHYADKHPRAPEQIQAIVDGLTFQVRRQPR